MIKLKLCIRRLTRIVILTREDSELVILTSYERLEVNNFIFSTLTSDSDNVIKMYDVCNWKWRFVNENFQGYTKYDNFFHFHPQKLIEVKFLTDSVLLKLQHNIFSTKYTSDKYLYWLGPLIKVLLIDEVSRCKCGDGLWSHPPYNKIISPTAL